jgi:type VI secretion system protein ImpG
MDPRLLDLYNQELSHLRDMGGEFAVQFPKIAARLGMSGIEVADAYVERLLEGFAFLTARVQLRLEAEFPKFTDRLLEICYPNFLAPMPAMLIARFNPNMADPNLVNGVKLPRGTALRGQRRKGDETACHFRSGHDVTLWPIEVTEAQYLPHVADLPAAKVPGARKPRAGLRVRLATNGAARFADLALDSINFHFSGSDEIAYRIHERLFGHLTSILVLPADRSQGWQSWLPASALTEAGYDDDEALLPVTLRGFQGYRLLQEYFAFPQRFLFADVEGFGQAIKGRATQSIDLIFLLDEGDSALEGVVDAASFALNCTPAVNLFEHRCDRIHLNDSTHDHHVVPDSTRPLDFEVHEILEMTGLGIGSGSERSFLPMYAAHHTEGAEHDAFYCIQRKPRLISALQKRDGARSSYLGSEVFIALVDRREAPYSADLRQVSVRALCTNRDLPQLMPLGSATTDFVLDVTAPVESVRVIKGPSKPYTRVREGAQVWRFINHLSLNHLSLTDTNPEQGAAALREMLGLYAQSAERAALRHIEGVRHVRTKPSVRRLPWPGRVTFGRGVEIEVEVDEFAFQGASAFLFGAVLSRFFARYASINSFTETSLISGSRGPIMHWGPRCGSKATL